MNEVEGLSDALGLQLQVVEQMPESALDLISACPKWTVRDVIHHSVGVTRKFTDFAAGRTDHPMTPSGDLLRPDYQSALVTTAQASDEAWRRADLNRHCHLPFGSFSALQAAGINMFDVLAHCWDVAVVTAIPLICPDELWIAAHSVAEAVLGNERDLRHYGPEVVVATDDPSLRFLAYVGRADVK